MSIELVFIVIIFILGITLIAFASRIGHWIYNFRVELGKAFSKTHTMEQPRVIWGLSSWYTIALRFGPAFDIWLIRIIGIGFMAGMILLIFVVFLF